MILLYLEGSGSKFHSVSTKTSKFSLFLDSKSWGKNMSTPKLVNFPSFGFQELRKNLYIHIYIIFKYVHMYITWFCYIWRVVVLSFIPSAPKLVNFHHFWIPGVEKKHVYIHIYIICKYVHMYITWFCYIWRVVVLSFIPSAPKLANFPFFWIPRVEKKHVYIYVYMCICQLFPTISPHFMGSSIANGISFSS